MRPHRLRVTAFGAFAGTEEVRFDVLDGLFLLHGETGAGKTTLLDAIAFALYGRVPGVRGTAKRLRSDHAAPGVATEVQLEATVAGRILRITRRPDQVRPKKSGSGVTMEHMSVILEERMASGAWQARSTRVGEADAEIRDLMGMSAEQFFQVVLLPQGQFAKFLHADAKDRAALLMRLFGTDRFERAERWLAERRIATARAVDEASSGVDRLLNRVAQEAGVPVPAQDAEGTAGAASGVPGTAPWQVEWADGLLAAATAQRWELAELAAQRRGELDVAQAALLAAERLADQQERRRAALAEQASLVAAAPSVAALREELDAASRAAEVAGLLAAADRAADEAERARKAADQARGEIPADPAAAPAPSSAAPVPAASSLSGARSAELRVRAQQERDTLVRLEGLRSVAAQAAAEQGKAASARQRAAALEADLEGARAAERALIQARPQAVSARDAASQAAADLPAAQATAASSRQVAADLAALVKARENREKAAEAHRVALAEALARDREYEDIRRARIEGMSGELARNLVDGSPCPVCGSPDHPEPSEMPASWVSPEDEKRAYRLKGEVAGKAEAEGQKVAKAQQIVDDLTARLASAGAVASEDIVALAADAATAEANAAQLDAGQARLSEVAARLASLQDELDEFDKEIAAAQLRQVEAGEQRAAALDEAKATAQRAAGHEATLREQLGEAGDLEAAVAAARQLAGALSAAAAAADEADHAIAAARDAREQAAQAALRAGFGGPDAVGEAAEAARAAMRGVAWRKAADEKIREHEASSEAVARQLADPALTAPLEPAAPVAEKRNAVAVARHALDEAVGRHDVANKTVTELAVLVPALAAAVAAVEPLAAAAAEARQLADLAGGLGANQYKMTLSAFVLAARLEAVAAAASQRLARMTAGRYSLAHTDERKGAKRSGLGLLACDSWTGQDRDTSTLSGGETFLASLALALGLADVVTAEAGGTPMEALFVDEGFGTLDEDTLEEVMTVLDGLREGGRMVGIVSHVSELRQRIPAQVHVRKGRHGSRVHVTAG